MNEDSLMVSLKDLEEYGHSLRDPNCYCNDAEKTHAIIAKALEPVREALKAISKQKYTYKQEILGTITVHKNAHVALTHLNKFLEVDDE